MKKIKFIPSSLEVFDFVDLPKPSKNYIPFWYQDTKIKNFKKYPNFNSSGNLDYENIKMCMPFLDTFLTGYIQETWCDIFIENKNNVVSYSFCSSPQIISIRENTNINDENFLQYFHKAEFIWKQPWIPKTPKNYSVLITHPLNRHDLPFYTLSGIIDSDLFYHTQNGNLPFFIKKDFTGLIPKGTPMFQVIPIKRDKWFCQKEKYLKKYEKKFFEKKSVFWEFYKRNMWQKKEYR
jgi:hypothetical protein